ncbi:MAG: hypothetical protein ACSLFF_10920 [Solirubrobacterales bacterium]
MSDGQFPSESPQDPVNAPEASSENLSEEPGLAPIGASTPGARPQNPDEPAIHIPTGGQYPEDMFGVGGDEAVVELPQDASSGGLADVGLDYGDPSNEIELPPPAEPQPLTELAMDPLPTPQGDAGGDMFSVDELIEPEPEVQNLAAPAPLAAPADNGDMFSIDDFADEQSATPQVIEPRAAEPLAAPEPLASPEPLAVEPLEVAPLEVEPVAAEPLASPEPLAAPEPMATEPVETESFSMEPIAPPEPSFELEQPVFEMDVPGAEPIAAVPDAQEGQPASDRELLFSQPTESAPPLAGEEIANPYAEVSEEADVLDPASGFTDEPEHDPGEIQQIVNPYAEVSNEAEVIDPAMALSNTDAAVGEDEQEVFVRSDPTQAPPPEQEAAPAQDGGQKYYQDLDAASGYDDADLPATDRTKSVAPPGMEGMVVGGLVVADGGKGGKKPLDAPSAKGKGKKAKRGSFGLGKKQADDAPQAEQLLQDAEMPPPPAFAEAPAGYVDPVAAAVAAASAQPAAPEHAAAPAVVAQPAAPIAPPTDGGYAQPGENTMQPAGKQKTFFGIKYGKPEAAPAAAMPATQPAAPAAPAAGKPKSFFGIKYGKPEGAAPAPLQAQAPEPAQAPAPAAAPVPQPDAFAVPPVPYAQDLPTETAQPAQPYIEQPQQPRAQVIQSAEAAAHAKKRGRNKKQKAPKQPSAQKSFFGIKYGGPKAPQASGKRKTFFGIKYGKPEPVPGEAAPAAPAAEAYAQIPQQQVAAVGYQDAVMPQQPIQAVAAAPTAFPGGYPADFASSGAQAPAAVTAAAPQQPTEQIMPPVAQTAQQNPLQAQPPTQ